MKGILHFKICVLVIQLILCGFVMSKECTNTPTQLSSHTFRYELLSSTNETRKQEIFVHYHLTPTDESAWASLLRLLPRKVLKDEDEYSWAIMYKKMKNPSSSSGDFLKEVSLHNVRLDPTSVHWRAQQTNLEYLLMLDVDMLVWSFRKTAGLATPGNPYGGWEAPDVELRGHFVGHYLSATAQMWASTHNDNLKDIMSAVVNALSECQEKVGNGYLSAFPSELFDRFEAIKPVWAPYYTIHKIMAGLLDQYLFANNTKALNMVKWMADYFNDRVWNVIRTYTVERHYRSLNEEVGGMNDVLYRLFTVTNDTKYLVLAHLFDKPCFLGPLALQFDELSGYHANTHIPIVIGAQMRYEVTGDPIYKDIGINFMGIVNSSHCYATGGTSVSEFWSDPKRLADTLQNENEESCTTYNMLKVSRNLFKWTKETVYADYYERALTNGVLSIQRGTEPGVMIYMLPLKPGSIKGKTYHGWGSQFNDFWCCYGTGIESFSKLGDSIYFEEEGNAPGLYVIQYIPSTLDWESGRTLITQKVDPVVSSDPYLRVTFTFSSKQGTSLSSTLNLRIPIWTRLDGAKALLNGKSLQLPDPGTFLSVSSKWSDKDVLALQFPISLRTEAIKDDRSNYESIQSILFGPYLLAGLTSGDWKLKSKAPNSLLESITPVPTSYNDNLVTFSQEFGDKTFVLANNQSIQEIQMDEYPKSGTNGCVQSTFRIIYNDSSKSTIIGKTVKLEPFDLPGMLLMVQGENGSIAVGNTVTSSDDSSTFRVVSGLDGKKGTVSLESAIHQGCYVFSVVQNYRSNVMLGCKTESESSDVEFSKGASFMMEKGLSNYHPISFVAEGRNRNFLLAPLFSWRDESYTVYFDSNA